MTSAAPIIREQMDQGKGKYMFYADRIVSYSEFLAVLADGEKNKLCNVPKPSDIPDLTDGADVALTLREMGHSMIDFATPYHHKVEGVVLFGDYGRFDVCITDEVWRTLTTREAWWESRPKLYVSAETLEMISEETTPKPEEPPTKAVQAAKPRTRSRRKPPEGEDGGASTREPRPGNKPSDDTGATVPVETPVG